MVSGAYPPDAPIGDTVPSRVQAGSRFQFAENTGAFNDCGVTRRASGLDSSPSVPNRPVLPAASFANGKVSVSPRSCPQSPFSTLIAVLTVPAIVVAVGLVWSQL